MGAGNPVANLCEFLASLTIAAPRIQREFTSVT
jgi:hypothetical protein